MGIHYNRLKVGQALKVGTLLQPRKRKDPETDEQIDIPHKLKAGEIVKVESFTVDSVTVVTGDGRKSTFAHQTGAAHLDTLSLDEQKAQPDKPGPANGGPKQPQQPQQQPGGQLGLED